MLTEWNLNAKYNISIFDRINNYEVFTKLLMIVFTLIVNNFTSTLFHPKKMSFLSQFTLFSCLIIHCQFWINNTWIIPLLEGYFPLLYSLVQGVLYLFYPVCGWIADVYVSNFKMIKLSLVTVFTSSVVMFVAGILMYTNPEKAVHLMSTIAVVYIVTGILGLGMYEANAIQFGMDQMIEASSKQLSSFIHWYFWCCHSGSLLFFYLLFGGILYFTECHVPLEGLRMNLFFHLVQAVLMLSSIQIFLCLVEITLFCYKKDHFVIEQTTKNPLSIVVKVLKYSLKHRYPENRSAFTYWENDIPSRIDLGKEKYGGPFTYEQVEDVKVMTRLLILMLSLFGFHMSGDGFSLTGYIMNTIGCPDKGPFAGLIMNPQHIPVLVVVFGIPLYQFMQQYIVSGSLLKRMWFGLLVCLTNEVFMCFCSYLLQHQEFSCPKIYAYDLHEPTLSLKCLISNFKVVSGNGSCEHFCSTSPVNNHLVYLSVIPLVMNGLSYLLVFMTTLEFICAQSPNAMKGLLIGVWYSMLSIKYSIVNNLDLYPPLFEEVSWNVYHGVKGLCIFISIICFSIASTTNIEKEMK